MLTIVRAGLAWCRVLRDGPATNREFARVGIAPEVLAARAADLDATTPAFAQTRGCASWPETARASAAFLALLREVPTGAGLEATLAHFARARGGPDRAS
jgi:hypothetical protein